MIRHALRARHFFPLASRRQAASQAVKYAKAVEILGPNWKLLQQVQKLERSL